MVHLLSVAIDCLSAILFLIPAMIIMQFIIFRQRNFHKFIIILIFALYITAVFTVTGIPAIYTLETDIRINLIPVIDIIHNPTDYLKNTILNIILFMPMGFLLPTVWKEYQSMKNTITTGLATSIIIELLQIFTFRLTDIDDIITNTLGTILGYYIGKFFAFRLPLKLSTDKKYNSVSYEPVLILIITLLISFLLKPLLSDMLWNIVLSSSFWERIK